MVDFGVTMLLNNNSIAKYLLRVGLAFVYVYASIEIYLHPANFLKYIPDCILHYISKDLFLDIFGVVEIALALWLLSGWKGHVPSLLSVFFMVGIVAFNMEHFQVLFRNVAIAFGALALVVLELSHVKRNSHKRVA